MIFLPAVIGMAAPALADSLWAGVYRHDITLAQTHYQGGFDIKGGWIGEPIGALHAIGSPAPHALASISLNGATNYAAIGLNWTFGSILYARPGIGLAVNDDRRAYRRGKRVDLGSPITFEPEIAVGWKVLPGLALEASWIHLSHATLFSRQNRGLDSWGIRAVARLR
ncbi:acyloxyacyl hydrolase [Sphingomonas profundi]|uniref:acyloxyacyl hydrolase n=1 Tax=Alterirhizorhabdus profundi TaxID=2681549 RepID=UPI0018D0B2E4|nr:acyloxyacyl hydrolase [Sphingomonas profundi]